MSAVIYTRPPNRLGQLLSRPGGKRISEAVADAEKNLATLAPLIEAELDEALASLRDAADRAARGGEDASAAMREVYDRALTIAGTAGLCERARMGEVAYNLCELSDRYIEAGTWNVEAIEAHVNTMTLLRGMDMADKSPEALLVLEALKVLLKRANALEDAPGT